MMREEIFQRTQILLGKEAMSKLVASKVAVVGLGGVGSFAAEALVRSGVGQIVLMDNDVVDISNINRQLIATISTIGKNKADIVRARALDINPDLKIISLNTRYTAETSGNFPWNEVDYIVDAIDSFPDKVALIVEAHRRNKQIWSSMGMANRVDPSRLQLTDIAKTHTCPLARKLRKTLRAYGISKHNVVFSEEPPLSQAKNVRGILGSVAFVPSVAGLILASAVVKQIIKA